MNLRKILNMILVDDLDILVCIVFVFSTGFTMLQFKKSTLSTNIAKKSEIRAICKKYLQIVHEGILTKSRTRERQTKST